MAIRRPSWDMGIGEIERRAKTMPKFDRDYFARQARADSAAPVNSEAVEREITRALVANMSREQVDAFFAARARGENVNIESFIRADSTGGLKMTERLDDSNRKIREFRLEGQATKRSTWMGQFMDAGQEMALLNIKAVPKDEFPSEQKYRADQAMKAQVALDIARGVDVRFDLETGERVR